MIENNRELFSLSLLAAALVCSFTLGQAEGGTSRTPPLYENLGHEHFAITTASPLAQRYFDQGLRLVFAFNHEEAIQAFEAAARLDRNAGMAYWGIAYALGPNINAVMDQEQQRRAYAAVQKARSVSQHLSRRERAYINALAKRYSLSPNDQKALDQAYADAMRAVARQYPEDLNAATLFAEALMDLRPWRYWNQAGKPQPGTLEMISILENVLQINPDHPGACHYYIHAVEASPHPGRALPCAERLPQLVPGAGHLVHMPAHIYMRLGQYQKASVHNAQAASLAKDRMRS